MQRIHFTADDLSRIRLKTTAGPLVETAFAQGLLGRGVPAPFARWRRQVNDRLAQLPIPLNGGPGSPGLDLLLRLIERGGRSVRATGPGAGESRPEEQLPFHPAAGDLSQVWRAAVAPYWDRLTAYLEAECEVRGRVLMAGGAELLLATLHSRIVWRAPVLELCDGPDEELHLEGRGLVLAPSVFLNHRPGQLVRRHPEGGSPVLAFAAPPDADRAAALWGEPDDSGRSLGALVGQTRAAALQALRSSCTTGELADRLGISAAGASQHTAVLRRAGLITTRRIRNTVLHTLTPLGVALLKGTVPRQRPAERVVRQTPAAVLPRARAFEAPVRPGAAAVRVS